MEEQQPEDGVPTQQPSESQQPADELAFPDLKPGDAWGESITKKRAAKLDSILREWDADKEHGKRKGPFDKRPGEYVGVKLSGADVFWLAVQADARSMKLPLPRETTALDAAVRRVSNGSPFIYASDGLHLEGAWLVGACLLGAHYLNGVHLEGAWLGAADLRGAWLVKSHLEGARLGSAELQGAWLQMASFDDATELNDVTLRDDVWGSVSLADVRWGAANLAVVDWTQTKRTLFGFRKRIEAIELGDEAERRAIAFDSSGYGLTYSGKPLPVNYSEAVRANRQLATALRSQGLNEDADRFAYKAQRLQREVLRRERRYGSAFGSWLLDIVAGYGYKPMRTLAIYLLAIITFAIAYFALGQTVGPHLSPLGAFVFSMTSFHGRGFFPGGIVLDDPITVLAAFEAFIGLVIEVSFIATFTQRFFAR